MSPTQIKTRRMYAVFTKRGRMVGPAYPKYGHALPSKWGSDTILPVLVSWTPPKKHKKGGRK